MIRPVSSLSALCTAGLLSAVTAGPGALARTEPGQQRIGHDLTIVHPGDAAAKPMPHTLVQTLDASGEPSSYFIWVDSVICRDQACDVVKVRLHWDALGRYQRFEVTPGSQLTKLDHAPFTKADLAKLHTILADPDSPLREVEKDSMTGKKARPANGVDAVSGPTILTLKTAVIVGAGYTCYDLWHWSNGLVTDHIRRLTGTGSSDNKLRALLASNNPDAALLAIEHLGKRGINDPATVDAVIAAVRDGDPLLVKPALAFIDQLAPTPVAGENAILAIFAGTGSKHRLLVLDVLTKSARKPTPAFCDRLCVHLPDLGTYFEIHRFLVLMDTHNSDSAKLLQNAAALLDHDNFLVSRRACHFLRNKSLPADIRKRVDAYHTKHADRL